MKTLLYFCLFFLVLSSCNDRRTNCCSGDNLGHINFRTDSFLLLSDNNENIELSKYIYLVYLDSTECMGCVANKFAYWKSIEKKTKNIDSTFNVCFIVAASSKMLNVAKKVFYYSSYSPIVFIDSNAIFARNNKAFFARCSNAKMFLLDEKRNVRLVGDPILNYDTEQRLYEIVGGKEKAH